MSNETEMLEIDGRTQEMKNETEILKNKERIAALEKASSPLWIRKFLELLYSLCKQYISWYEENIKTKKI